MANGTKIEFDGALSFEGGIDGGRSPIFLSENQAAYAINTTFRGGFPKPRPKVRRIQYTVDSGIASYWASNRFQGASGYRDQSGKGSVVVAIGGKTYRLPLGESNPSVIDMVGSNTALENNPSNERVWFAQAEHFLVDQDGRGGARIYDGVSYSRSPVGQIPVGTRMAYGIGRLWVASGNSYYGGDLVDSDPALGASSVLRFTENEYLNEGGAFRVPTEITGFAFTAKQDTVSGEGSLMVLTRPSIFEFDAPVDRTIWSQLQQPLQRFSLLNFGGVSGESTITVNGDLFFRSEDGIRSFYFARRDFTSWGNTPISTEVESLLSYDNSAMLRFASAANFDNRALFTASPELSSRGVKHSRLVAIDFHLISGMRSKSPPAWEGEWTFDFDIYQILTVDTRDGRKCIMVTSDDDETFAFWEVLKESAISDETVSWGIDTRSFTFNWPMQKKRLHTFEAWLDKIAGTVNMDVWFKRNSTGCWSPWARYAASGTGCATLGCTPPTLNGLRGRSRVGMPKAPTLEDAADCDFTNEGYDFQFRLRFDGDAVLKRFRVSAEMVAEAEYPAFDNNCTAIPESCETCN